MALELRSSSSWWYARFAANGKLRRVNLRVKVEGRRPSSITEEGDPAFERSRGKALGAHDKLLEEIQSKKSAEELRQEILEIKTGTRAKTVAIKNVPDLWTGQARKRHPSAQYLATGRTRLQRFVDFMGKEYPQATELASVQGDHVRAFMAKVDESGVSPRSWNIMLGLLKGVFRHFESGADAYRCFLQQTPQRIEDTVHRKPFAADELKAVLDAAQSDPLLRPLVVTAICTAMRRGDCATLRWAGVDLVNGFITVKTAKTGETVDIPILPPLLAELQEAASKKASPDAEFVFPEAAKLFQRNPWSLDRRLKVVLLRAGFVDEAKPRQAAQPSPLEGKPALPTLPQEEVLAKGLSAIETMSASELRRSLMRQVFQTYMDGKGLPAVAKELSISKSTVSLHLREIEAAIGTNVVRWKEPPVAPVVRGVLHAAKGTGPRLKRGTLRGWHSFRTTFITTALSANMPIELVRRVTGHQTVDVVLKHYFRPGREEFRRAFVEAMPKLLTNGERTPIEEAREIVAKMTGKTMRRDKVMLIRLLTNLG